MAVTATELRNDIIAAMTADGRTVLSGVPEGWLALANGFVTFFIANGFGTGGGGGGGLPPDGGYGDITVSGGGGLWAVNSSTINNAKLANMAAHTLKGNSTAGLAAAADLTTSQVKTMLAIAASDVSGLAAIATSGSGADLTAASVTNAKLANMATATIKGNNTGGSTTPSDLTAAQVKTLLAIAVGDVSGLAAIASSGSASDLSSGTVPVGRMPALTGDVTTSAGAVATTIGANKVLDSMLRQSSALSILGNATGSTANVADIPASANGQVLARQSGALAFTPIGNIVQYLGMLGDGSDGAITFNGSSTITLANGASMAPTANVYTLTSDICATDITISPGVTVKQNTGSAFRIFWTGTFTINGTLSADGGNASSSSAGATGGAWVLVTAGGAGSGGGGGGVAAVGGSVGALSPSLFVAAAKSAAAINTAGTTGGAGQGGTGGGGASFAGGTVGANTQPVNIGTLRTYQALSTCRSNGAAGTASGSGFPFAIHGLGGSGGGGSGVGSAGGGGGGGAGGFVLVGRTIAGSGTISCKGGNGGNGNATGTGNGGGGGGGGGTIILAYANGTVPTTNVSGGTGGTATGTGGAGGAGGVGAVILVNL